MVSPHALTPRDLTGLQAELARAIADRLFIELIDLDPDTEVVAVARAVDSAVWALVGASVEASRRMGLGDKALIERLSDDAVAAFTARWQFLCSGTGARAC